MVCGEDEICVDNFCVLDPDAGGCVIDGDCFQGYMCEVRTGDCIPDPNYCDETILCEGEGRICDLVVNQCIDDPNYLPPPIIEYDTEIPVTIEYGRVSISDPQGATISPSTWNLNGNILSVLAIYYLNPNDNFCGGFGFWTDCWVDHPNGAEMDPYDFDSATDTTSPQISFDVNTGEIHLDPFEISQGALNTYVPPPNHTLIVDIHWVTSNPVGYSYYTNRIQATFDINWVAVGFLNSTTDGNSNKGKGSKKLTGPNGGAAIVVPKALNPAPPAPPKNNKKKLGQGTRLFRRSFSYTSKPKPLSAEVIAKKRLRKEYGNGINNSSYTFFNKRTTTSPVSVWYNPQYDNSVTGVSETMRPSVLGELIDETLAGILNVNSSIVPLSDYYYNAITSEKVKNSFSSKTQKLLRKMHNLNGSPLRDSLATSVRRAIISNEVGVFSENDIEELHSQSYDTTGIALSVSQEQNNKRALRLLTTNLQPINPEDFNIKKKNRMIYWKPLAEDLDKRLVYETADGTSTNIYIPNNEKITVEYSAGKIGTLEMQDGDFFVAETLSGDNRLSVHSEIEKARIITPEVAAQASYLADDDFYFQLDATSVTSNLVELNVDTTSARQDYYFLALDKDSIEDQNLNFNSGDTSFTRKTYAKYNYITTGIDDVVKHKAYPNLTVYLRNDDMFFNHLESSQQAQLIHKDLTLDNFENSLIDQTLIRQLPQHILIIPSDKTARVISQQKSKLIDFTTRRLKIRYSPVQDSKKVSTSKPNVYLRPVFTKTESLNFGMDIEDNVIWNEKIKFVFDTTAVAAVDRYKNGAEVLPRKETPMTKLLKALNNIKDVYSLTERDNINTFDLFSRMEPSDLKSLSFDVDDEFKLLSRLARNSLTDDADINKSKFVKTKAVAAIPLSQAPESAVFLPVNEDAPQVMTQKQQTSKSGAPAKSSAPSDRSGELGS